MGVAGKYERTPEIRAKISAAVTAHHQRNKGNHSRGWFVECRKANGEVYVRSTWEERVVKVLDAHPCVLKVTVEPFVIPYVFLGDKRRYIPDFHIELEGEIHEVWEIKPEIFAGTPKNRAKLDALNAFVEAKGWNARLVHLADIEGMEMQVGLATWNKPGQPWVRPDDPDYRPCSPKEMK